MAQLDLFSSKCDVKDALNELQQDADRADLRLHLMMVRAESDRNGKTLDVELPPASELAKGGLETWMSGRASAPVEPFLLAQAWLIIGHDIWCARSPLPEQLAPLSTLTSDGQTAIRGQTFTKLECFHRAVDSTLGHERPGMLKSDAGDPLSSTIFWGWFSLSLYLEQNQFVQLGDGRQVSNVDCLLTLIKLLATPAPSMWFRLASAMERSTSQSRIEFKTTSLSLGIYPRAIAQLFSRRDALVLDAAECLSHGLRLLLSQSEVRPHCSMLPDGLIITSPPLAWLPLLSGDAAVHTMPHDGRESLIACTCTGQGGGTNPVAPWSCRTPFTDFWWNSGSRDDLALYP